MLCGSLFKSKYRSTFVCTVLGRKEETSMHSTYFLPYNPLHSNLHLIYSIYKLNEGCVPMSASMQGGTDWLHPHWWIEAADFFFRGKGWDTLPPLFSITLICLEEHFQQIFLAPWFFSPTATFLINKNVHEMPHFTANKGGDVFQRRLSQSLTDAAQLEKCLMHVY